MLKCQYQIFKTDYCEQFKYPIKFMSILIIGVGEAGARIAEKINQHKIAGVNCAIVVSRFESVDYETTITEGINIWDGYMRSLGGCDIEKKQAEDNIEAIKSLIIEGTNEDWE